MVQQQHTGHEPKRAARSFLTHGATRGGRGNYGASFRTYRGQSRVPEEDIKTKGNPDQVNARSKLAPAKTIERVHNLAELLRECRAEIGTPHPDQPGRMIVSLGTLMNKFKEVYGLPAWGKNMSESELYKQISVEKYSGVLKFWSLRDGGDYYVEDWNSKHLSVSEDQKAPEEPIENEKVISESPSATLQKNINETTIAATSTHDETAADRSIALGLALDSSFEDFSTISEGSPAAMLISKAADDGFFESGPGFGGNLSTPQTQPNLNVTSSMSDLGQRFGNVSLGRTQPLNENSASSTSASRSGSRLGGAVLTGNRQNSGHEVRHRQSSSVQPMRPVSSSFGPRAIIPQNGLQLLVKYVKSRGSTKYESLPEDDQTFVNFNSQLFKVYANQPGEMLVRLVNPSIDPETVKISETNFREPVEADLRWMSEVNMHVKRGLLVVRPVMFVAPRGFLMVACNTSEADLEGEKLGKMEELLRGVMTAPLQELSRRNARPGMAAVYIYRQGEEVRYYRVLLVGRAQQGDDVLALLADHNDQHMMDVKLSMLYVLPEKASFRRYAPNVYFGTLYGVMSLSPVEQENMWKNLDDEDRKNFVAAYIPQDETKILNIDMVWTNENRQYEWLSQLAKRRGAIPSPDSNSNHVTKQPEGALKRMGEDCFMEFCDFTHQPPEEPNPPALVIQQTRQLVPEATKTVQPAAIVQPTFFNPRLLNMYAVFDELVETNNVVGMVKMLETVKIIRNMKQSKSNDDWKELINYMIDAGRRKGIQLEL
ncbi:hypothetical protein GCK72_002658 [Caenorhabditis remanei]|uniref:HTH OST-type domain-containing protein n=1 Tax=Caenorhabditis remanei TaxID=31234 RepID=A0A6A5HVS8_CAERE|nr:hypothetical protein GCK72_002658 [Caenorhabditis remanei]KAF1770834.1 hypothetical protein GCK72_002658 [Caenorhabditis remanei]